MTEFERELEKIEKLVEEIPGTTLAIPVPKTRSTKRNTRKLAEPHLRAHKVKGKTYYSYCRGSDKEIYLGSAEVILRIMTASGVKIQ